MTVVMEQISSGGKRRQCNSRCHSAKHPKCTCICGGKFHGSARDGTFEQKVEELRKPIQEMIDEATKDTPVVVTESLAYPGPTVREVEEVYHAVQGRLPLEVA